MKAVWAWLRRVAPWLLALTVLALVADHARELDWPAVGRALRKQPPLGLVAAAVLALLSMALVASYDLIGRRLTGHRLSAPRTLGTAAISYVFNLNFGALVGGFGLRLRMYTQQGLAVATVARVIVISMLTNWLGYLWLAGGALLLAPPRLPAGWPMAHEALPVLGGAMWVLAAAYVALCAGAKRRRVELRGHALELPSGRVALWQSAVATFNWALMGGIVWWLLQGRIDYPAVLAALLAAAVVGVVTHVPAGLGVLEAVFLVLLRGRLPEAELLAALLAYRATYYLIPLAAALPAYLWTEAAARRGDPASA